MTQDTQEIAVQDYNEPMSVINVKKQVNLIQHVMREVMIENVHYGKIPGCGNKPTLYKAGAEKLNMTFRLAPTYYELTGCREDDNFVFYKIKCTLINMNTGQVVGEGLGACNSREKKYIKQSPWDVQNTLYKMACKRALVAAVLNGTAASDIFTQDIEDMNFSNQPNRDRAPRKTTTAPTTTTDINVAVCSFGKNTGTKWIDMSMAQLRAYQQMLDKSLADPEKAQYKSNNEFALREVLNAMEVVAGVEAENKAFEKEITYEDSPV